MFRSPPATETLVSAVLSAFLMLAGTSCQQETMPRSTRSPQAAEDSSSSKKSKKNNDDGWESGTSPGKTNIEDEGEEESEDKDDKSEKDDQNDDDKKPDNDKQDEEQSKTSGGSGGKTGLTEVTFRAANGQNSSYKINAPADAEQGKSYGLHIHLHGDGGGGYRDFPNKDMRENLIGVTVKAPNRNLQWGRSEGVPHAAYVQDLIQNELLKKYNIQLDRIFFSGVSGGAYFLTGSFLPQFGHHYNSGAFILCGGEAPRVAFAQPEMLKSFRIYWQITAGERQDITSNVRQSISAYDQALTKAINGDSSFDKKSVQDTETKGPGGHCEFDEKSYTTGIQYMIDTKFNVIFKK